MDVALLKERTYAVAPEEAAHDRDTESTLEIVSPVVSYNTEPSDGDDKTGCDGGIIPPTLSTYSKTNLGCKFSGPSEVWKSYPEETLAASRIIEKERLPVAKFSWPKLVKSHWTAPELLGVIVVLVISVVEHKGAVTDVTVCSEKLEHA